MLYRFLRKAICKHEVSNYRPISLTSLVMKTFERIIKDELLKHTHSFIDNRSIDVTWVPGEKVLCNEFSWAL